MSVTDSNCNCAKLNRWEKKLAEFSWHFFFPRFPRLLFHFKPLIRELEKKISWDLNSFSFQMSLISLIRFHGGRVELAV